jgi:mono/diheme cytochrome c family protein
MAKIDEQISYNWLFFLLAGAFGAVTFWAVYDETATRREYKNYQEAFFKIEVDLADKALKAKKKALEANGEYSAAKAETKKLEDELAGPKKAAYAADKTKLEELKFIADDKQQDYTFTKSNLDETYYYFTKAKHELPAAKSEYDKREKELKKYEEQLKKDDVVAQKAMADYLAQEKKVKGYTARIDELTKIVEKHEAEMADAERKYATAVEKQKGPMGGIFGPGTEIVQQNIEDIGKVDRCESCHYGSNRGGFETVQPKYFQSHPYRRTLFSLHPVEKFGCTTCHDGQGRATTKFYAHAPTDNPHYFEKHFWEEPLLKGAFQEANCRKCHTEEYELRAHIRCEVDAECPQKPVKTKCDVPSQPLYPSDTSIPNFLPPAEGAKKEEPAKYCVNPDNNVAELVDLSPHLTRGRRIIEEVGCYGCHPIEGYEKKPKPAPDLRHAKSKLQPGWIIEWVKNPKAFHPRSRMPNFFPEELRKGNEYPKTALPVRDDKSKNPSEPWKWTVEQQTTALTSYLLAQSTPYATPKAPSGDAKNGKALVLSLGCRGCHNITEDEKDPTYIDHKNRASHFDHGPNLVNVGSKTNVDWLYAWLKNPKAYAPDTRMPNLRLSDQEAADIAAYLVGNRDGKTFSDNALVKPEDKEWVASGQKLMNYYGCYGCHLINGYEGVAGIGADLSDFGLKEVSRLDYGDHVVNHRQQTWEKWLEEKLKHPRVYRYERVDTRMPQFDLSPEEIEDVMVVLKGMRGQEQVAKFRAHKLSPIEQQRERGRELMRWYNCYGCHIVDGHVGDIRQAKEYQGDLASFAPPNISGQGAKTQPPWLFGFFKNVIKLRPWLTVRMPTFGFEDQDATSLVAMFSAFDHADYPYRDFDSMVPKQGPKAQVGKAMFEQLKCTSCHVVGDVKLTVEEAAKAAPNLLLAKQRLRPEWIVKWLSNPEWIMPGTRMPSFWGGGMNLLQALLGTPDGAKFKSLPNVDQVSDSALHQMEVVRDHVYNLEGGASAGSAKPAAKGKKAAAPGRKHAAN